MGTFGQIRDVMAGGILLTVLAASACSRQIEVPSAEGGTQTDEAPFRTVASDSDEAPASVPSDESRSRTTLPFHDSQSLPAGTLLTVRLNAPIAAGKPESFEGSLEETVMLHGKTAIARGTLVSGRVESTSPSSIRADRAYVRLALTSVRISGTDVRIHTASLFARQHRPDAPSNPTIRLETGRRLTFRLTEPVYIGALTAQVTH
jgi:hypothetical protein